MAEHDVPSAPRVPGRVPSGIPGLDAVLRGGFFRGGVYIVRGAPGTGKTIFGHQLCFAEIASGGRALYVTLLSENHARMILNLRGLSFYDPDSVADRLYYISAFRVLEEDGLKGLLSLIRRELERHDASLLALDGLLPAERASRSDTEFKKFINDLQTVATAVNCTMFLLTSAQETPASPEQTMVDGILELTRTVAIGRALRHLVVHKFRGGDYVDGRHAVQITGDGVIVYPRLEGYYSEAGETDVSKSVRLSTGIDRLDQLTGGGLPSGTATLVMGPAGSGKTTIGLHFLRQANRAEPALFFGFHEPPWELRQRARSLGLHLDHLIDNDSLALIWQTPTERVLDCLGNQLLETVRRRATRRLVVDGIGGLERSSPGRGRIGPFMAALSHELRRLNCTSMFTLETPEMFGVSQRAPLHALSALAENIFLLRYVESRSRLHRLLLVLKVRHSSFQEELREFVIGPNGIDLAETFESAAAIMAGATAQAEMGAGGQYRR